MTENKRPDKFEDEIDLVDLFRKIWKWKWLTIGLTVVVTTATFLYIKSKPEIYTAEAGFVIGKIAGISIDSIENLKLFLYENRSDKYKDCSEYIKITQYPKRLRLSDDSSVDLAILYISGTNGSSENAYKCTFEALNTTLKYHSRLYKDGIEEMRRNINSTKTKEILKPEYVLKSYNYPTRVVLKLEKPIVPDEKKYAIKIILVIFSTVFLGIVSSLFLNNLMKS